MISDFTAVNHNYCKNWVTAKNTETNKMDRTWPKICKSRVLDFKSKTELIKVQGAFSSFNLDDNIEANFFTRIQEVKTKINLWMSRELTLMENLF